MSTPQILHKKFETENVIINTQAKVLIMKLRNKFNYAGQILFWPKEFSIDAFGINQSIFKFLIENEYKLLINYQGEKEKIEYWINYDKLKQFAENHKSIYQASAFTKIHNIPCSLFQSKPNFSGGSN